MIKSKQEILNQLKAISTTYEIPNGFQSLGKIEEVYPDLPKEVLECERTWIWEWPEKALRIATHDYGNGHCSFICEGTPEKLIKYLPIKQT